MTPRHHRRPPFWLLLLLAVVGASLARASQPDFLVDAGWLEGQIKEPKTVVLEVRYFPHQESRRQRQPGADAPAIAAGFPVHAAPMGYR